MSPKGRGTETKRSLILYVRKGCPFSAHVRATLARMKLPFEERNLAEERHMHGLLSRGGRIQTPYIIDEGKNTEMYESEDIVAYLARTYGVRRRVLA